MVFPISPRAPAWNSTFNVAVPMVGAKCRGIFKAGAIEDGW
jgi:hypothetical protein